MVRILILLFFLPLSVDRSLPIDEEKTIILGSKSCKLILKGKLENNAIFLSLHDDENTSVIAFNEVSQSIDNPVLIELQQSGSRFIKYGYNGLDYLIDPNRIFTEIGINNTLKKNNKTVPAELKVALKKVSIQLIDLILPKDKKKYIVAIHNNSNDNYSAKSYVGSNDAEKIYMNPSEDPDDFFFVTNLQDFEFFKTKKRNVILQSLKALDDGSFSIYCARINQPYINIEAQDGHKETQKLMIKEAYQLIQSKQK
jgi:hypothetical protein